ncbi:MAG TPA: MgtC/SapB family protein, partial [Gemmatimonadales bacterium]|nr:MgtC/SapB family protein [Gemmatimonadales bacterium]
MPAEFLTAPANPLDAALSLTVAALVGLAVGIERQWSGHASGPEARFAGMRTFLIIGITAGTAGILAGAGQVVLAAMLILGIAASAVAAFVVTNLRTGVELDGTTEAAALAVAGLGLLAGGGQLALAAGATAVIVFALGEKERLHGLVESVGAAELQAAARFAVMALVVLPLLPATYMDWAGGLSLRAIWALVLAFSALNFAGYLAL